MQVPVISRYFPGILIDPVKDYEVIWNVKSIAQGFFLAGYFPVIPWALFPMLGVVMGRRIVKGKMRRDLPWLVMGGITLAGLGLGMALTAFGLLFYFFDVVKKDKQKIGPVVRIFNRTSSFSLTFYFMHYMLIGWTLGIIYFITGKYYITNLMGSIPALLCGVAGVVLLELILVFWEKHKAKYSLEWFLVVLTIALTGSRDEKAKAKAKA